MSCEPTRMLIRALPRAEWSPRERARVEAHAAACAECGNLLAAETRLETALEGLLEPPPKASLTAAIMARCMAAAEPAEATGRESATTAGRARAPAASEVRRGAWGMAACAATALTAYVPKLLEGRVLLDLLTPNLADRVESIAAPFDSTVTLLFLALGLVINLFGMVAASSRRQAPTHKSE